MADTLDESWRSEAAAFAVAQILRRDHAREWDALRQTVVVGLKVRPDGIVGGIPDEKRQLVSSWCADKNLISDWIEVAVTQLLLFPNDQPTGPDGGWLILWADEHGEL